jgi:hypothetical protein
MRKLLLIIGIAVPGILLLSGQNGIQKESGTVAVQMIVTVEARHGHDIPSLKQEDMAAHERKERLKVEDLVPLKDTSLDLFLLLDDASAASLGFNAIAVEADWPDSWRVNRCVQGLSRGRKL